MVRLSRPNTTDSEAPFLSTDPPPMLARALATFLIVFFLTAIVASVFLRVPETVVGRFTLVPVRGTDPVRALRHGQISAVRAAEGDTIMRGMPLFILRSEPVADRSAELGSLQEQLRGADDAVRYAQRSHDERRQADEEQQAILRARLVSIDRAIALKIQLRELAANIVDRYKRGTERGVVSDDEYAARQLEEKRISAEQASLEGERTETQAELEKLRHEIEGRDVEFRETLRRLSQDRAQAEIRARALTSQVPAGAAGAGTTGMDLVVSAPCTGTVLRMRVRSTGAVVQEGEVLGEVACTGEQLQAEVVLPQSGVARVRKGQSVKLLYDAFPYQRFGVRLGHVRWVSPATATYEAASTAGIDASFRALIDVRDSTIRVDGAPRRLLPGMGGTARIVVERRALVSYAFEPIRQLRESLSGT